MSDLRWYLPLEECSTLDGIRSQWQTLLERSQMAPWHNAPRYGDAMLSFLGACTLAPQLKLAAVLACGSAFDFDFRLAVGLLKEQVDALDTPWPAQVSGAVSDNGPALPVDSADPWLRAFIAGRLAGLRETFGHDGLRADDWRAAFWNRYLEMACRHADTGGVATALAQGADPRADSHAAVLVPAKGVHGRFMPESGPLTPDRTDVDYQRILLQLVDGGLPLADMLEVALPPAAAADNTDMLGFLLAQGADIRGAGGPALAAAARSAAGDALGWLLAMGRTFMPAEKRRCLPPSHRLTKPLSARCSWPELTWPSARTPSSASRCRRGHTTCTRTNPTWSTCAPACWPACSATVSGPTARS
ncbi:hypothetical protein [Herbaspirillum sp. SJZ107]|uniref:hypothetical protein n=1 Tax=Herbaspirillum sp. SJZ107 TaxID=2572881 RepID=UPI00114EF007|nr:hypothetical protein [Herbaspirillum sp. SJZ107]TQK01145.1 hypothetical protein FBX97_5662 [Herbaspirillum sp. SJZ107]